MTSETLQSFALAIATIPAVFLGLWIAGVAMSLQIWTSIRTVVISDVLDSISIGLERLGSQPPEVANKMRTGEFDEDVVGDLLKAWDKTNLRDPHLTEAAMKPVLDALERYASGLNAVRNAHREEMKTHTRASAGSALAARDQLRFENYWLPLTRQVEKARNSLLDYVEAQRIWGHVSSDLRYAPVAGLIAALGTVTAVAAGTHSPSFGENSHVNLGVASLLAILTSSFLIRVGWRLRTLRSLIS